MMPDCLRLANMYSSALESSPQQMAADVEATHFRCTL